MLIILYPLLYTTVALWFLTGVGNWACRLIFSLTGMKDAMASAPASGFSAGWIIGWFERLILAAGIVTQSWEAFAAVVALKTVARFKELDNKDFAEYFLVGSLFSIFWAIIVTSGWIGFDRQWGSDVYHQVARTFEAAPLTR